MIIESFSGPPRPIVRMIICGSRDWADPAPIRRELLRFNPLSFVISGGAKGADMWARNWARELHYSHYDMPADWDKYGKAAGPIRNQQMLDFLLARPVVVLKPGDRLYEIDQDGFVVLAFHPFIQNSKGTKDMVTRANMAGVRTEVYAA